MKKLISAVLSLCLLVTSVTAVFAAPSDIPYGDRPLTVDTDGIDSAIKTLQSDLKKAGNRDKVFEDYRALLDIASQNGDVRQINMLELEKLNFGIGSDYDREFIDKNIDEAVKYGNNIKLAVKSILDSRYAKDFTEYWGEERTEHVSQMRDNSDDFAESKKFYDRYFTLRDSNADGIEFARLLKEIVDTNNAEAKENGFDNCLDFLYTDAGAGFDTADLKTYIKSISDYYYYVNKFKNYGSAHGWDKIDESLTVENPLEALAFVTKIDPQLKTAYDHLVKNELLFLNRDDNYRGVTASLYYYGDAGIIISAAEPMSTLIHEFGHYQSFFNSPLDSEELFFGVQYENDMQELNSQAFELIATEYYDDIYGENADGMRFRSVVSLMQQLVSIASIAAVEITLYSPDMSDKSAEELNDTMTSIFGETWYLQCQQFFTSTGNYINYSLMLFNALQIYDEYLKDNSQGIKKYLAACSLTHGSYGELTEQLGLISAFGENAGDYLKEITENIFKTKYNVDYATALDYFENKTYLGRVAPTVQRVSVNGGAPKQLAAYNSSGFNYIRIRDLAMLLNGTDKQFDVEYDTEAYTVNIIPNTPYTPDGSEMSEIEEIKTAGQKNNGTFTLMYDGEPVLSSGAMFINGWNCYRLRGLVENGVLDLDIDYDAENDIVMIRTKSPTIPE